MTDDIVTRCIECFNLDSFCTCPKNLQVIHRKIAVEARHNMKCALQVLGGLSGLTIHPDYYNWWVQKGKPNAEKLDEIILSSRNTLDGYVKKYGEGQ